MFFIFPAHSSHQLFLFMPPAGAFLSIAKERFTVVSAGFQPFARRENRDTSSKPPCCIRHRRRFGILFVAVDKKYAAGDKKKELLGKVCHRRRFGDSEHRRVSRFPAPLGRENRDTSSKSPRFLRHRRRFGDYPCIFPPMCYTKPITHTKAE